MTGTMTEASWTIDAAGDAGGVGLLVADDLRTELSDEPWLAPAEKSNQVFSVR